MIMSHYTVLEIQSIAILTILLFYLLFKVRVLFRYFGDRSLLNRNKTLKKLKRLSWYDFELLCMELFKKNGWNVKGNEQKGADGGVDIWLYKTSVIKKNRTAIVQCKRYEDSMVTIKIIREMYGLMHEYSVDEVYVVTTSRFTKECKKFIEGKNIVLIDGHALVKMINSI